MKLDNRARMLTAWAFVWGPSVLTDCARCGLAAQSAREQRRNSKLTALCLGGTVLSIRYLEMKTSVNQQSALISLSAICLYIKYDNENHLIVARMKLARREPGMLRAANWVIDLMIVRAEIARATGGKVYINVLRARLIEAVQSERGSGLYRSNLRRLTERKP